MTEPDGRRFAVVESNTTGTGRKFCAAAVARGLRPIVLTRNPAKYPYIAEDAIDTIVVDTGDSAAVLDAARVIEKEEGLAGVTSSSEYFVATAASTATAMGLPAPDAKLITRCRDKETQRTILAAAGVPVPAYRAATDIAAATRAAKEIGFPVVVKPPKGSGSVGVRLCHDSAAVADWAADLLTDSQRVLVEEHVEGPEFSVETFDDEVVGVVRKYIGPRPHFVETGHDFPACGRESELAALRHCATTALTALGLTWGPAHTEIRSTERGPVLIEVNPRLGGGMIPELVRLAAGIDLVDNTVARVCGQSRHEQTLGLGHSSIRFVMAPAAGTVNAIAGVAQARRCPGVQHVALTVQPGDALAVHNSFRDRLGFLIATAPEAAVAAQRADAALECITIDVR